MNWLTKGGGEVMRGEVRIREITVFISFPGCWQADKRLWLFKFVLLFQMYIYNNAKQNYFNIWTEGTSIIWRNLFRSFWRTPFRKNNHGYFRGIFAIAMCLLNGVITLEVVNLAESAMSPTSHLWPPVGAIMHSISNIKHSWQMKACQPVVSPPVECRGSVAI